MTSSYSDPRPDEVAHVTFAAAELLKVLWEIHEGDEAHGVRSA
ncbi:hypothetical protein [Streptomyces cyaneus]|nr:hypothetical protein [Streptomyces cyaneus]